MSIHCVSLLDLPTCNTAALLQFFVVILKPKLTGLVFQQNLHYGQPGPATFEDSNEYDLGTTDVTIVITDHTTGYVEEVVVESANTVTTRQTLGEKKTQVKIC